MDTPACPWSTLRSGTLHFCEAQQCAWIVSPAETWSNLAYFFVAGILWSKRRQCSQLTLSLGFCAAIVGVFSFIYHMSHTWVWETLDLGSMLFLTAFMVRENLSRLGLGNRKRPTQIALGLLVLGFAVLFSLEGLARTGVFLTAVFLALGLEARLAWKDRRDPSAGLVREINYTWLGVSLGVIAVAYTAWWLDFARIVCHPENHFVSGHAVWHVVSAFCFLTLHRFYGQFIREE